MKKLIALVLALSLLGAIAMAEVAIDAGAFPDEAFREVVKDFDKDGDGVLSDGELAAVEELECSEKGIQSLKGLENFAALRMLFCHDNEIAEVDLSGNPALTYIELVGNQLTALDLSNNPELAELYINHNQITELDVSACPLLVELVEKTERASNQFDLGAVDYFDNDELERWMWIDPCTTVTAGDIVSDATAKAE